MEQDLTSYLVVTIFVAVLILLLIIRKIVENIEFEEKVMIEIGNDQTIGRRKEQDDYFATAESMNGTIAVLADGISGLANGRMASSVAVNTFIQEFKKLPNLSNVSTFFKKAALISNDMILENLNGSNGGTTLVSTVIDNQGYLYWSAVGDSVISIFRQGEFIPVNQKHIFETVLKERYISGEISHLEMEENPLKKRITNYLGYEGFKNIDVGTKPIKLEKGDKVCLYSDGIYNTLTEIEMEKILSQNSPPQDIAEKMIEAVERKQYKKQDNASIVILEKKW